MNITFFTTSTFSDVQQTQSNCVKKWFPESEHFLIDGRKGWFDIWYKWLEIAQEKESKWFIHLDEDCFITSDVEILNIIEEMEKNEFDIAGCPDGHHEYRSGNHMAINSFFMIVSSKCINEWHNRTHIPQFKKEWIVEYPFVKNNSAHYEYNMEFGSSGKPVSIIWKPGTEPYYDFMWVLKEVGIKFKYLEPIFDSEFQSTNLLKGSILHMWHQRERNSMNIVSSAHTMPNKLRYDVMLKKINEINGI